MIIARIFYRHFSLLYILWWILIKRHFFKKKKTKIKANKDWLFLFSWTWLIYFLCYEKTFFNYNKTYYFSNRNRTFHSSDDSAWSPNIFKNELFSLGQNVGACKINSNSSSFLIQPSSLLTSVMTQLLSTVGSKITYNS